MGKRRKTLVVLLMTIFIIFGLFTRIIAPMNLMYINMENITIDFNGCKAIVAIKNDNGTYDENIEIDLDKKKLEEYKYYFTGFWNPIAYSDFSEIDYKNGNEERGSFSTYYWKIFIWKNTYTFAMNSGMTHYPENWDKLRDKTNELLGGNYMEERDKSIPLK